MSDMVRKQILPAIESYEGEICATALAKRSFAPFATCEYESEIVGKLSALSDQISAECKALEGAVLKLAEAKNVIDEGYAIRDTVLPKMATLRAAADEAETVTAEKYWPFPSYCDLLFGVK